jgi:hypothetical protein
VKQKPGVGVDASGGPVVDPTANVLDLVSAAVLRQDDLRKAEASRWDQLWTLKREHDRELRNAEKERLDAIRKIDVDATTAATKAAEERAATLAAQTDRMAETLRQQVALTASQSNAELKAALQPLQASIEELRRWQYETAGQRQQTTESRDVSGLRAVWIGIGAVALFNAVSMAVTVIAIKP